MAIITLTEVKSLLGMVDPVQASGLLTVGRKYEVKVKGATGNFANVGGTTIEVGDTFFATGTTPTLWGGTILYIVNETQETKISALIPEIEADFLLIRNRPFQLIVGDTANASATVSNVAYFDSTKERVTALTRGQQVDQDYYSSYDLLPGQTISGSGVQASIVGIDDDTDTITLSVNASSTVSGNTLTAYPIGSKLIAADMINFRLKHRGGEQSESIGSYSYSLQELSNGYPKTLVAKIGPYVGCK